MSFDQDEVRRRLADAVSGLPFDPPDPAPLQAEGRRRRRNRRIASATGGLALSLAVVAGVIAVGPGQSASPKPAPVLARPSARVTPSPTVRPVAVASSTPSPAVATSTVDPTAPVRLAYANTNGVWIATFDPTTAHPIGTPVRVSDAFTKNRYATGLEFSPQGRYLVWQQGFTIGGGGVTFGLYDGETGKHVTVAPWGPGEFGSITATGTGGYIVQGAVGTGGPQAVTVDRNGVTTAVTYPSAKGLLDVIGTYPDGLLVNQGGLLRLPVGTDQSTALSTQDGANLAAANAAGVTVATQTGGQACQGIADWTVIDPDGATNTVAFTQHRGRDTMSLSVSPDGVVGGVVQDCGANGTGTTSFVELDGVIAHTTATDVVGAARGPHDVLAEVRGHFGEQGIVGDQHLRIYDAHGQLVDDLGVVEPGDLPALAFAPEHLP